jgi:hypothetical protein
LPRPPFVLFGLSSRGVAIHFGFATAAFAFHRMALPMAILHSSVATGSAVGASGRGTSGSVEVFGVGCTAEVFGVGCTLAVSCQDPYFHTLTNGRQRNVSLILLCSSGLALGLRPLLSSQARAILTSIHNVSAALPFILGICSLISLLVVLWYSMEACWMVLGPGDLVHSTDESSV